MQTHPIRMFVFSILRDGQKRHAEFVDKGAVRMGSIAKVNGYYLTTFHDPGVAGLEMVPALKSERWHVAGEMYMLTPTCFEWVDGLFRNKLNDRVVVPVEWWKAEKLTVRDSAWTYVYSSVPTNPVGKYHSLYDIDQKSHLTGGGFPYGPNAG